MIFKSNGTDLFHYSCKTCGYEFWGLPGITTCPNCEQKNVDDYEQDPRGKDKE